MNYCGLFRLLAVPVAAALVVSLAGCTTVETKTVSIERLMTDDSHALRPGGVMYWLPKRSIKVSVTIAKTQADKVEALPGAAYPDFSRAFLLSQGTNALAEQKLKVVVNERGLLQSATASSVPKIQDALQELASAVAARGTMAAPAQKAAACADGEYAIQIQPEDVLADAGNGLVSVKETPCGYTIEVQRLFPVELASSPKDGLRRLKLDGGNGFYVRQELPYRVVVTNPAGENKREFIVFSPSEAPVAFVPLATSLFASTTTSFVLTDGSLREFDQTKPSEAVALLTLPAQVIGAYFDAIGNLFTKRKAAATNEADFLKAKAELSTVRLQADLCAEAVRQAKSLDDVKAACLAGK